MRDKPTTAMERLRVARPHIKPYTMGGDFWWPEKHIHIFGGRIGGWFRITVLSRGQPAPDDIMERIKVCFWESGDRVRLDDGEPRRIRGEWNYKLWQTRHLTCRIWDQLPVHEKMYLLGAFAEAREGGDE